MQMRRLQMVPGVATPAIYVVIRVFNLGDPEAIGIWVYVDPYTAEQRGELVFGADKYAVRPGRLFSEDDEGQ